MMLYQCFTPLYIYIYVAIQFYHGFSQEPFRVQAAAAAGIFETFSELKHFPSPSVLHLLQTKLNEVLHINVFFKNLIFLL